MGNRPNTIQAEGNDMNVRRMAIVAAACLVLGSLFAASAARAVCGSSPSQPPGTPPYGMNVQGDAGGTKLSGIFEISFGDLHCEVPGSPVCNAGGPDLARAKGTLRLRKDNEIHAFYIDLGEVRFNDIAGVQALAMEEFRAPILESFFAVAPGSNSSLQIFLKEITQFSVGSIFNDSAPWGTYVQDVEGNRIVEFSAVADVVVAVK